MQIFVHQFFQTEKSLLDLEIKIYITLILKLVMYYGLIETDGAIIGAPTYDNGKIYFGCVDGYFFCLDENNPQKYFWRYITYSKIYVAPLVVGNIVYFGADNGLVYAFDKITGKRVWNLPFSTNNKINSAISGDDSSIFSFLRMDIFMLFVH